MFSFLPGNCRNLLLSLRQGNWDLYLFSPSGPVPGLHSENPPQLQPFFIVLQPTWSISLSKPHGSRGWRGVLYRRDSSREKTTVALWKEVAESCSSCWGRGLRKPHKTEGKNYEETVAPWRKEVCGCCSIRAVKKFKEHAVFWVRHCLRKRKRLKKTIAL